MSVARSVCFFTAALVAVLSGCQHAAMTYRLRREGKDPILFPPTTASTAPGSPASSVSIKQARDSAANLPDCDVETDVISLHWQGTTANLSLRSQAFFAESAEQSPMQTGPGMYLDPLRDIEKFHTALIDRQSMGCLRPEESERLRRAIVENFALPPVIAYFVQLGSYDVTGYFDLTPDFRIQVAGPTYPEGAEPTPEKLSGYETANYRLVAEGPDGRARLTLTSVTEFRIGATPIEKDTVRNALPFSKEPGYFRLMFMAEETATAHIKRAILLSAAEQKELTQAVARRNVNPNDFCAKLSLASVTCTVFPENYGVSPELRLRVNGKDDFIPVGGMLMDVLNPKNRQAGPPHELKILRPYQGKLIPIQCDGPKHDLMRLILLPGDQVTF
jgi:hypothetical protein